MRRPLWLTIAVLLVIVVAIGIGLYLLPGRGAAPKAGEGGEIWTCPMHPSVIRSEPGDCPICGMDLVLQEETAPSGESEVEGRGVVDISPEKQQLIGVVTTPVERRRLERVVRTVGRVAVDESRVSHVHS